MPDITYLLSSVVQYTVHLVATTGRVATGAGQARTRVEKHVPVNIFHELKGTTLSS
jgi:hypothetical protein